MLPTPSPSLTPHTVPFFSSPSPSQAMPGPLFNFAAYLGAIIAWNAGYFPLIGTIVAWFGLFTPGVGLMFACLPFWTRFRSAGQLCGSNALMHGMHGREHGHALSLDSTPPL